MCVEEPQRTDEPGDEEQAHVDAGLKPPDQAHRHGLYPGRRDDRIVPEDAEREQDEHQRREGPPRPKPVGQNQRGDADEGA